MFFFPTCLLSFSAVLLSEWAHAFCLDRTLSQKKHTRLCYPDDILVEINILFLQTRQECHREETDEKVSRHTERNKLPLLESVRRDEVISSLWELGALLCWKSSSTLFLIPATDKWQLSDRQLIVIVCLLLIIHAVCLSRSQKTRVVLLFRVWRGWSGGGEGGGALKCFVSPCAPRVTKSTTDGEQDKRSRDWSFFAFSSEVVTLTFPLAYVILPTPPNLLAFSPWSRSYWPSGILQF